MRVLARATTAVLVAIGLAALLVAALAPPLRADDAGAGIHTEQIGCTPEGGPFPDEPRLLRCVAVYRNTTHRPLFDLAIEVRIGGRPAAVADGSCCPRGTRRALAPGESAVFVAGVVVPDGVAADAPVELAYRAALEGDASDLAVPHPELHYVDRAVERGRVVYRGEVRNVDGGTWQPVGNDPDTDRRPIAVFYHRGTIVGADTARRWPNGRIAADGRGLLYAEAPAGLETDGARFFFREAFSPAVTLGMDETTWELVGLDHGIRTEPGEAPQLRYTITLRNPTALINFGDVHLITRRADYHALSADTISIRLVPPGAMFREAYYVQGLFPGYTFDDVRFVTLELGGGLGRVLSPTPETSPIPCPSRGTPVTVPTLAAVAAHAFLPWAGRFVQGACP
ncbi:MAG: hypothetical protein U0470_09345 [Anaerolineae bacterium]